MFLIDIKLLEFYTDLVVTEKLKYCSTNCFK